MCLISGLWYIEEFRCVDATGRVTGVLIGQHGVVVKALSQDGGEGSSQAISRQPDTVNCHNDGQMGVR